MKVMGLDLSLTSTGCANHAGQPYRLLTSFTGVDRLRWFRIQIEQLADSPGRPDLVALEGYSMGSKFHRSHAIGELGGVVRLGLDDAKIPVAEIPPACVKKFATGRGNAPKDEVFAEAIRRLGYQGNSNDEADALWLRAMALHHYGEPVVDVPKSHLDGLTKVEWPELGEKACAG